MANIAVGDIAKVALYQRLYGQRVMNVLYYRASTVPGSPPDTSVALQALATKIADETDVTGIVAKMLAAQSNDVQWEAVRAQLVYPTPTVYSQQSVIYGGGIATPAGTPNVAVSITKQTETFGRHGVGRMQLAGPPQDGYEEGILTGLYKTEVEGIVTSLAFDVITDAPADITWKPVLFTPLDGSGVYKIITHGVVQNTVRDMRRRTVGLGE